MAKKNAILISYSSVLLYELLNDRLAFLANLLLALN